MKTTNSIKILIIEDDLSASLELEMMLDNHGYAEILNAANFAEAAEIIDSETFDLPSLIFIWMEKKWALNWRVG